jgi:hypothetical protein
VTKHNADNERIKREYFTFLKEAKRRNEPTVDASAKALNPDFRNDLPYPKKAEAHRFGVNGNLFT